MVHKHDFLLSIGGAIAGTIFSESNVVLSSVVYILTALYTSIKIYKLIKEKK
jgi:hypothetical protein